MLDDETTLKYIARAKGGDSFAKEELLKNNSSLLKCILRRYLNKGVEYDDLYQLASLGLLKAVAGFDESFGVKFSTYAVPMIAGEIKRFMRDDGSIKVSRLIKKDARDINAYIDEYSFAHGETPTVKNIAEKFKMEESEVAFILASARMPVSIDGRGEYKDDETDSLSERLPSKDTQDELIDSISLKGAINELDERERKIIILRYFRDYTQSEVADMIGVSQVQISRIESRIIARFKDKLA